MNLQLNIVDKDDVALVVDNISFDDGVSVQNFPSVDNTNVVLTNNSDVTLTVTLANYFTYTNTFKVFTEDVAAIKVMMIEDVAVGNPEYMIPYVNFFYIDNPCSFETLVYFGSSMPFGVWHYQINGSEFASTRNSSVSVCDPGTYDISAYVALGAAAGGCSTPGVPAFTTPTQTQSISVVEYRPDFSLSVDWDCCPVKETLQTVSLASFIWNNTQLTVPACTTANLTYNVYDPAGTVIATATYAYADLVGAPIPLEDVNVSFTPSDLGTFKVEVIAENCCTTITREFLYDICNSWVVSNPDCNVLKIENLSSAEPLTYTIKELTDDNTFSVVTKDGASLLDVPLSFGNSITCDLVKDNIYTVSISQVSDDPRVDNTDLEYVVLLDCNIRKCKKELLRLFLCEDTTSCKCAVNDLTEFTALSNIVYRRWNIWKKQQSIFTTLDINDIVDDITTLRIALDKIAELCKDCANDNLTKGSSNGCNCK